jgi:hypothetical protein
MKTAIGCAANLAYFVVFAAVFVGALLGNHCVKGPCLSDAAWLVRLGLILIGGFAIWFCGAYLLWRRERRSTSNDMRE